MIAPTPRGADVVRRARQLGLSAEYVGPGVKIDGKTRTVAEADAYVWGYFTGSARAHRAGHRNTGKALAEVARLERVIEIARDHDPQLIDGIEEANR